MTLPRILFLSSNVHSVRHLHEAMTHVSPKLPLQLAHLKLDSGDHVWHALHDHLLENQVMVVSDPEFLAVLEHLRKELAGSAEARILSATGMESDVLSRVLRQFAAHKKRTREM